MKRLKKYKVELELLVHDRKAVIKAGRALHSRCDWKSTVADHDGDELFAAMSALFCGGHAIPDHLGEIVEFFGGGISPDGDVPENWAEIAEIRLAPEMKGRA